MTEKQIEYGFWLWDKENDFPPESVTYPDEYKGQRRINIACTQQLNLTLTQQKKLINSWSEFLPTCTNLEILWFTTHTTQQLFDSACKLNSLTGLNIKWSSIKSLENISKLKDLKYLRVGSSAKIESINPLTTLTKLEVLDIENFKKITDFSILTCLSHLKFLSIEGGMYTKQKVDSFEFTMQLTNLIYFGTTMISCRDRKIDSILHLKNLITLNWPFDLSQHELSKLKEALPKLRYWPHRYHEQNMNTIKGSFR